MALYGALFTEADVTISQKLPELLACRQTVIQTTLQAACTAETEALVMLQDREKALTPGKSRATGPYGQTVFSCLLRGRR